ncbi:MAG: hypothetical protein RL368_663 [Pseudomonadota bacterium]|jgi:proteic killer suppression protein
MIKSFHSKELENCFRKSKCAGIRPDLRVRVLRKLDSMDAATCLNDLQIPPSNHLHILHDEYEGYHAINVSGAWRLVFKFDHPDIYDVMLVQYH